MKITNLVKALEKSGLTVEKKVLHKFQDGSFNHLYICRSNKRRAEWHEQSHDKGEIQSVYICAINDKDDLMSDYFPGTFYDTIKSVVNALHRE